MLRTAFLVYLRVLLCLQGLFLAFWAWVLSGNQGPDTRTGDLHAVALIAAFFALAGIATAIALRRDRRWAAIAAIVIEALWAAAVAAAGWAVSTSESPEWPLYVVAALFLATVAGLLLRPVRAYAGLIRG